MIPLTHETFDRWMTAYGCASAENDPQASTELFTRDACYYENPFIEPMIGRDAIYQYWYKGAQTLKDKESVYEILAINDNLGIARWQSKFTVIESGRRFALDCLFVAEFDDDGLCRIFREWWHLIETTNETGAH
ncbi:MAG: nuclear transport factor 2 family protein [Chloroflexota bacterium]